MVLTNQTYTDRKNYFQTQIYMFTCRIRSKAVYSSGNTSVNSLTLAPQVAGVSITIESTNKPATVLLNGALIITKGPIYKSYDPSPIYITTWIFLCSLLPLLLQAS